MTHASDRDRGDSAKRTEGEGVPAPSAVAPRSGTEKDRNLDQRPREKAQPQRRREQKPDKR